MLNIKTMSEEGKLFNFLSGFKDRPRLSNKGEGYEIFLLQSLQ